MARDHTRVNLDIWGDDEFRELPVDSQNLYWTLWTSPGRSYCGSHEWRPGKLSQSAGDWTVRRLEAAAAVASERLFLIIDEATEECLLRSWIKHDGLWRTPNMAVSMAMARAEVASKILRGVIVHEVKKLVAAEPTLGGWKRDEVVKMLTQKAIDPTELEPFNPSPNPGGNPLPNPTVNPYGQNGVNPPPNPPSTTATSTTTPYNYIRGHQNSEGHQGAEPDPRCPLHMNFDGEIPKCPPCGDARRANKAWHDDEVARKRRANEDLAKARRACPHCDENGMVETPTGMTRCTQCQEVS